MSQTASNVTQVSSSQSNDFTQQSKSLTMSNQYVQANMDSTLISKKIEECIQYILYCCLAEKRAILKRVDINKNILKEHSKGFLALIIMVKQHLNKVFGFDLVDIDGKQEKFGIKTRFQFDTVVNKFKVQSTTKINLEMLQQRHGNESFTQNTRQSQGDAHEISDEEFQMYNKYSLLMISLSLIFMNNNEMDAGEFWNNLKRININRNEKRHPFLGDVEKYFTQEMVKDGYLEYEHVRGTEPPTYKFKWGFRSRLEISKRNVLEFVCKMYGSSKAEDWNIQFEDAKNDDGDVVMDSSLNTK
jgi:hypothetical protein